MKLGLGLYSHLITPENLKFAKQVGCTHIVVHMVNYFEGMTNLPGTDGFKKNWGTTPNEGKLWTVEELLEVRRKVEAEGLVLEAIENFDPAHWYDVLLDGPKKQQQLEDLKTIIRRVGEAGIPVFGYNFSLAGVWGHIRGPFGRGGAMSVGFNIEKGPEQTPIPNGQIWNMTYNTDAPEGFVQPCSTEELWDRLSTFLKEIVPVAEEAGVRLAAHPDDPPMTEIRGMPRLVNQPHLYQKLLDIVPSNSNALEFCMGSIQEMSTGNIYEAIEQYGNQDKIAYVHFRNVKGKVPNYQEVFVDEGDIDMIKALRVLKQTGFDGLLMPDHTPDVSCDAPWHAGMAYALGYMKAAIDIVNKED